MDSISEFRLNRTGRQLLLAAAAAFVTISCGGDDPTGPGNAPSRIDVALAVQGTIMISGDALEAFEPIASGGVSSPRLAPDGSLLAYVDFADLQHRTIRIVNARGETVAAADLGTTPLLELTWSADGERIFGSLHVGDGIRWDWEAGREAETVDFLESNDEVEHSPTAPVIALGREGDIWLYERNGGQLTNLTDGLLPGATEIRPRWSPDGDRLVFMVFDENPAVSGPYIYDLTNESLRHVASNEVHHYDRATFRPDGDALLVDRMNENGDAQEVVVLATDGTMIETVDEYALHADIDFDWK